MVTNDVVVRELTTEDVLEHPNVELITYLNTRGYPTPALFEVRDRYLIMERVHGPTLLQALIANEVSLRDGAQILVDLLNKLHTIAVPAFDAARGVIREGDCILHMDLQPVNVILTETGPAVVDWQEALYGPAALDFAATALAIGIVAAEKSPIQQGALRFLEHFIELSHADIGLYLDEARDLRIALPYTTTEDAELIERARETVLSKLSTQPS
ncbi:phosphotransferase [Timonella sp. A28]|uniref:phosphotransferase n=1 Tax=Timonella sp. A28 TaxID=3442640 RepID=UPI003EBBDACE